MNALTFADESPLCPLSLASVGQARVPRQRHADRPTVDELDNEDVVGERHMLRPGFADFTRR